MHKLEKISKLNVITYTYTCTLSLLYIGIEVLVNCSYTGKNDKYKPYRRVMRRIFRLLIEYKFHPCPYNHNQLKKRERVYYELYIQ